MEKNTKEILINSLIAIPIIILIVLGLYEIAFKNVSITNDSKISQIEEAMNRDKDYQTFSDYQFKVKCPAILKDVSNKSNYDFDFNYAGTTDDSFYQIMIIKLPTGYKDYKTEDIQSM
jgi:hypothetical protein